MSRAGICADFRIERGFEPGDLTPEPSHHLGDDVVRANAQALAGDLQRQMPIAEMPGNPQQIDTIGGLDFEDRLGCGADTEKAAAVELETVALGKVMCPRQIEQKGLARIGDKADTAAVPV